MKLSKYREDYGYFTSQAGNVGRQAAFAGIALIWIFKGGDGQALVLPRDLMLPSVGLILALAFDLLQYLVSAGIWGWYCRYKEKQVGVGKDAEFDAPAYFNWPSIGLFWGKLFAVVAAYALLLKFAWQSITFS